MKKTNPVSLKTHSAEPRPVLPDREWEHFVLWRRVKDALNALRFISGVIPSLKGSTRQHLYAQLNALGATIENQVVETLNQMRSVWDSENRYQTFAFIRQPQSFPDVVLRDVSDVKSVPIMGIELKGWYLIAKEGSQLRFTQTPDACAPADDYGCSVGFGKCHFRSPQNLLAFYRICAVCRGI